MVFKATISMQNFKLRNEFCFSDIHEGMTDIGSVQIKSGPPGVILTLK